MDMAASFPDGTVKWIVDYLNGAYTEYIAHATWRK